MGEYYFELNDSRQNLKIKQYVYCPGRYLYNWHREIELMIILKGQVEVCVEGVVHELYAQDMILINSNCGHASLQKEVGSMAMVIHINPDFFLNYFDSIDYLKFGNKPLEEWEEDNRLRALRKIAADLCLAFRKEDIAGKLELKGLTLQLIASLIKNFPPHQVSKSEWQHTNKNHEAIKKMINILESNYSRKITLDELAGLTAYNRTYISTLFKAGLGINFYDYLMRIRLQHALFELDKREKSLLEIALESGFSDVKSFNAFFKKQFRKTPNEYRRELQTQPHLRLSANRRILMSYPNEEVEAILKQYSQLGEQSELNSTAHMMKSKKLRDKQVEALRNLCTEMIDVIEQI